MGTTPPNDGQSERLFQAALLCGAGRIAAPTVKAITTNLATSPARRTCIDGGSTALLVVRAPGRRIFDVCLRHADVSPGVHHWHRTRIDEHSPESWDTRLFVGAPQLAANELRRLPAHARTAEDFARLHSRLGPNARLFLTSIQETNGIRRTWIGWHLDKHFPAPHALTACGLRAVWPTVVPALESLMGKGLPIHSQGWSLMAGFDRDRPVSFRLGTTLWSRLPESPAKLARYRTAVDNLGGDRSSAEALYRLLLPSRASATFVRPVGCAVEFELDPDGLVSADFVLRLESPYRQADCHPAPVPVAAAA